MRVAAPAGSSGEGPGPDLALLRRLNVVDGDRSGVVVSCGPRAIADFAHATQSAEPMLMRPQLGLCALSLSKGLVIRTSTSSVRISGAVDGDVAGGRGRPNRDVRLAGRRLGGRLQSNPDIARHRVEVEPGRQVVGHPDRQGAGRCAQVHRATGRGDRNVAGSGVRLQRGTRGFTVTSPEPDFAVRPFASSTDTLPEPEHSRGAVHPCNRDVARAGDAPRSGARPTLMSPEPLTILERPMSALIEMSADPALIT